MGEIPEFIDQQLQVEISIRGSSTTARRVVRGEDVHKQRMRELKYLAHLGWVSMKQHPTCD